MTEQIQSLDPTPSQVIVGDADGAVGGGRHLPPDEVKPEAPVEPKRMSTREAIEAAIQDQDKAVEAKKPDAPAEKAADPEKPADAAKPEKARGEGGKFAKAEQPGTEPELDAEGKPKAGQAESEQPRPSEGRGKQDPSARTWPEWKQNPPARFLPEAREKWDNVPDPIKQEFHRIAAESESENQRLRQEYEPIQRYAEMARAGGTTLDKALEQYVGMERLLSQDFGKGVASLAQNSGMNPAQALGAVMRAFNVTPQQIAQAAQQNPHAFTAPAPRQQQQAPQVSPREAQLQQENEQLRQQAASARIIPVIDALRASRPDFQMLETQMAAILDSGVIERLHGTGLSVEQRADLAYRMAGGRGPASNSPDPAPAPQHSVAPPNDPAGSLSVRGAPGSGQNPTEKRFKSNREALEAAFAGRS